MMGFLDRRAARADERREALIRPHLQEGEGIQHNTSATVNGFPGFLYLTDRRLIGAFGANTRGTYDSILDIPFWTLLGIGDYEPKEGILTVRHIGWSEGEKREASWDFYLFRGPLSLLLVRDLIKAAEEEARKRDEDQ